MFIFLTKNESYQQVERIVVITDPMLQNHKGFRKEYMDTYWSA